MCFLAYDDCIEVTRDSDATNKLKKYVELRKNIEELNVIG